MSPVLIRKIVFPKYVKNASFQGIIEMMMKKSVLQRLTKVEKIRHNAFFHKFEWSGILNFELEPPYLPKKQEVQSTKTRPVVALGKADLTDWSPDKFTKIDEEKRMRYDKWFDEF